MFSAVLLAAGESTRMRKLKSLLPWGSSTLIEAQLEQIAFSRIRQLIVVVGYQFDLLYPVIENQKKQLSHKIDIQVVYNEHYRDGKTTSIRTGIKNVSPLSRGIGIISVDQPVLAYTLDRLTDNWVDDDIRIPTCRGEKGHPPFFSVSYSRDLSQIKEETQGLRHVMRKHHNFVRLIEVNERQVLLNLNNETDYNVSIKQGMDRYNHLNTD